MRCNKERLRDAMPMANPEMHLTRGISPAWFGHDVIARITLAALSDPNSLA
jgi:hypothetical protein